MALPAGRYGVTKNQLLKIKKLPMNTIKLIEELIVKFDLLGTAAFKNSTSVVTESTDLVESGAVKDIVGWGNKNLLPYPYYDKTKTVSGITFTVNTDGSVTVSGTATDNVYFDLSTNFDTTKFAGMLLNGLPNVSGLSYRISNQNDRAGIQDFYNNDTAIVNNGSNLRLAIRVNNGLTINNPVTFYPMISKDGGEYEPYHASVNQTLRNAEVIEGKNLLAFNLSDLKEYSTSGTWSGNVYTRNGVTFTYDESDNSITVNGTATGGAGVLIIKPSWFSTVISTVADSTATGGGYIISDGENGRIGNADLYLRNDGSYVYIQLSSGKTANNVKFYPMIRLATESNPTYEPYYVPLKDVVPTKADNTVIAPTENGTTIQKSGGYVVGSHAIRNDAFITWKNAKALNEPIDDANDYTSGDVAGCLPSAWVKHIIPLTDTPLDGYGTFAIYENVPMHLAFAQWIGNGNAPSTQISTAIDITPYMTERPIVESLCMMRNGDMVSIHSNDFKAYIYLKAEAWSGCTFVFPTQPA